MNEQERKHKILTLVNKHFSNLLTETEKHLDNKNVLLGNYKKFIQQKINECGNDLLGDLLKL